MRLFPEKDSDKFLELIEKITQGKPIVSVASLNIPQLKYEQTWLQYLRYFFLHGMPTNKQATRSDDLSKERRGLIAYIYHFLRKIPAYSDLKETFNLDSEFDIFESVIDEDIAKLVDGN